MGENDHYSLFAFALSKGSQHKNEELKTREMEEFNKIPDLIKILKGDIK